MLALLHYCLLRLDRLFLSFVSSASLRFVSNNNLQYDYSFQFLFGLLLGDLGLEVMYLSLHAWSRPRRVEEVYSLSILTAAFQEMANLFLN